MALAIDAKALAQSLIPRLQRYLDQYTQRFQIHRLCAHATVIHDASAFRPLLAARELTLAKQEALDWQADQGDDLHEGEVFKHLQQQAATSPLLLQSLDHTNVATSTLVASALSPSFTTRTHGRPLSSFHRHSLRCSFLRRNQVLAHGFAYSSAISKVFPSAGEHYAWVYFPEPDVKIVWATNTGYKPFVVWNLQLDVVDLWTRITTVCSGKRRRTALNQFLQVSSVEEQDRELIPLIPEAKRFRGVRYRPDRRTWVAEMRPYKGKGKVQFGEFKSQEHAAAAVDAAFHHYGKPQLLNFPDRTPHTLSARRPRSPASLNDKLRFVKAEAKWLGSVTSTLPSAPASLESRSRGCSPGNCSAIDVGDLRSFSEISSPISCGGGANANELADDGTWMHVPASVHITDGWDVPELTNSVVSCPTQRDESQRMCLPFLVMSPQQLPC